MHQNTEIAFSPRVLWGGQLLWHAVRPETPSGVALDLEWATQHVSDQFMDNTGKAAILPAYTVSQLRASLYLPKVKDGQVVDRTRFDVWVENALDAEYSANGYTYSYFYGPDFYALENFYYPQAGRHINMALTYSF